MKGKILILIFFILEILIQISISKSEENVYPDLVTITPEDNYAHENAQKIFDETVNDVRNLVIRFNDMTKAFDKRLKVIPKPISNVEKSIYMFGGLVSLRKSLDEIFPKFWKVSKREECEEFLNKRIQEYVNQFENIIKNNFNERMAEISRKLNLIKERLHNMLDSLRRNYETLLEFCVRDNRNCQMTDPHRNDVDSDLEYIEQNLKIIDIDLKTQSILWVRDYVYDNLIPSVERCVDE